MTNLYDDFDSSTYVAESDNLFLGKYRVQIIEEEIVETPASEKQPKFLKAFVQAVTGEHKGKVKTVIFGLWSANLTTARIAKESLQKLGKASGKPVNNDNPLKGRYLVVNVTEGKGGFVNIEWFNSDTVVDETSPAPKEEIPFD